LTLVPGLCTPTFILGSDITGFRFEDGIRGFFDVKFNAAERTIHFKPNAERATIVSVEEGASALTSVLATVEGASALTTVLATVAAGVVVVLAAALAF